MRHALLKQEVYIIVGCQSDDAIAVGMSANDIQGADPYRTRGTQDAYAFHWKNIPKSFEPA